jgi:hypothetical protein
LFHEKLEDTKWVIKRRTCRQYIDHKERPTSQTREDQQVKQGKINKSNKGRSTSQTREDQQVKQGKTNKSNKGRPDKEAKVSYLLLAI